MSEFEYPRPHIDQLKRKWRIQLKIPPALVFVIVWFGLFVIFWPALVPAPLTSHRPHCFSNLKQLSLACLMYSEDYDERLPLAPRWFDSIYDYSKNTHLCHDPDPTYKGQYGLAYRMRASGLLSTSIKQPAVFALLFDSVIDHKNARGELSSLPRPGRHGGRDNIAFFDGHAYSYKVDDQVRLPFDP